MKPSRSWIFGLGLLCLFAIPLHAEEKPETPTVLKGGKIVTSQEARELHERNAATFFDIRTALNFGKGHIPGANNVVYKEKSEYRPDFDPSQDSVDLKKLPADKKAPLVFYSDGPNGWKSYKFAVVAIRAGYTGVHWMRLGYSNWLDNKFPVERD